MTEVDWHTCSDPRVLLTFVAGREAPPGAVLPVQWASERKVRLFLTACCRRQWGLVTDAVCRMAVEVAERFAEGEASDDELAETERVALTTCQDATDRLDSDAAELYAARNLYYTAWAAQICCQPFPWLTRQQAYLGRSREFVPIQPADRIIRATDGPSYIASAVAERRSHAVDGVDRKIDWDAAISAERSAQCDLLRDIFGNPFRPVTLHPSWLTSTAVQLARGIYADRAFDRLPILADALQDAGCDHPDVLNHCRGDGPHVRGCWVVDLVLGKE